MNDFDVIKQILDNSHVYYLVFVDINSQYAYLNKKYVAAFNGIHGDLIGQHYSKTMHPDDTEICKRVSQQCFEYPERIFPATIRKHDGKGGFITTQWEYKAVFDMDNKPVGVFCIGNDITEFLATRRNLEQTMKSLSHANLTLEEIAHIQSHVIRKPIANILGLAAILETMEVEEGLKDLIEMISSSARALDEVIKSVSKKI
jgi:PAS domain S-box-containing protein